MGLALFGAPLGCDAKSDSGAATSAATEAVATAAPSADLSPTGVKACDDYLQAAAQCMNKSDEGKKRQLSISIAQQRNQVSQATTDDAKEMVAIGCEAELDALREDPSCN